jgi:hypothetical protein
MAKNTTTTTEGAPDPILRVTILTNGILINDCHHAAGKLMSLPKSQVDVLLSLNPPAVKVEGI